MSEPTFRIEYRSPEDAHPEADEQGHYLVVGYEELRKVVQTWPEFRGIARLGPQGKEISRYRRGPNRTNRRGGV